MLTKTVLQLIYCRPALNEYLGFFPPDKFNTSNLWKEVNICISAFYLCLSPGIIYSIKTDLKTGAEHQFSYIIR